MNATESLKNYKKTKAQNYKNLIPDQWYAIYLSAELKKKPVSIKRLGLDMVLWRDQNKEAKCAPAACPHRGANLGLGKIVDGQLQCKYHGFCFNNNGRCTAIPCEGKDAIIPKSLDLKMIDIKEEDGLIWFWFGKGEPDKPIPKIKGSIKNWRQALTVEFTWDVPLSRVMEGMMDIHHLPFAHQPWMPGNITRLDPYNVKVDDGIIYTRGILRDENNPKSRGMTAVMNVGFPSLLQIAMGKWLNSNTDTEGLNNTVYGFDALGTCTPIDEESTWIAVYYTQSYIRIPLLSQLFNAILLQFDLKLIQPDDYLLLKSSEPSTSFAGTNHLVRADLGIAEWHRLQEVAVKTALEKENTQNAPAQIQEVRGKETETHSGCCV